MSPAVSEKQRNAMAIALHSPEKVYSRNRGMVNMKKNQLEEFASISEKGLPKRKGKRLIDR